MLLVVAIFAPLIAPYNPLVQDLNSALVAPNAQHWFGTDEFGRDIFSRLVYGSRITLYIVLLVSVTVGPLDCCWASAPAISAVKSIWC